MQAAFVGMILDGAFLAVSFFRGDHWRLTSEEKLLGGSHLNNVVLALLPEEYLEGYNGILQKCGPILGAIVPLTAIVGRRIAIDNAIAVQAEAGRGHQGGYNQSADTASNRHSPAGAPSSEPLNGATDFDGAENHSW